MTDNLLFYDAYENFYDMAQDSTCFKKYCKLAFGEDFSQDGFSDIEQVNLMFEYIPKAQDLHMLDIGCGNGKMLGYLQSKVGGHVSGFDFSQNAITSANCLHTTDCDFRVGTIGEVEYQKQTFDFIVSMDTMYFASDMVAFVAQISSWLKSDGVFFVGYQEGDIMNKTCNSETTILAQSLSVNNLTYDVIDMTKQTYEMLHRKRKAISSPCNDFSAEKLGDWYDVILHQTDGAMLSFEEYQKSNARWIYIVTKE